MRNARLGRFVAGVGFGYLHTVSALVIGVFLTPYLLSQLGGHAYGLWLLGAQVVAYLALMDIGIVALVPRELAFAVGQGKRVDSPEVRALVARTRAVIWWQLPVVATLALATWWLLPSQWAPLRGPLAVVIIAFVVLFPLRVFPALLQGLQDLGFQGAAQFIGLLAGSLVTFTALWNGAGLYALALGWIVTQIAPAALAWARVRHRHAGVRAGTHAGLTWADSRAQLSRGAWISVGQIAQVLLTGTDLVIVGTMAGPESAVVYACTGKLVTLLAHQPQLFLLTALPALSELRGAAARERLDQVSRSMTQLLFLASGAIVTLVMVVNEGFVSWWVGAERFGGFALTAALVATMFVRQVNFAATYTLFCFGYERRIALTSVADGATGLLAMLVLVPMLGPVGAALGLLAATLVVSLPANLRALGRETGLAPLAFLAFWKGWAMRLAVVLVAALGLRSVTAGETWMVLPVALAIGAVYLAVMVPELTRPPLGPMLAERLGSWSAVVPALRPVVRGQGE
jgi:O-antigen/teichoic acid export membrane protein